MLRALVIAAATSVVALTSAPYAYGVPSSTTQPVEALTVRRGGPVESFTVETTRRAEALLRFTTSAPRAQWGRAGSESGVVRLLVDGRLRTHLVVPSARPTTRTVALGRLTAGRHVVQVSFDAEASSPAVSRVNLTDIDMTVSTPNDGSYAVLAHAPVVIGRALSGLGKSDQNATTDTPLLAWHETRAATTPGHRVVTYSVVWSNEDGGTEAAELMAQWGRTTDIEWIYRVELDQHGERVPGSDVYQAPNHRSLHFAGGYEQGHPLLQTCTANNNMCDKVRLPAGQPGLRFMLATDEVRKPDRARESLMDAHPWTYAVMAEEMSRERKIERPASAVTPSMSDQRNYLWLELRKRTGAATTAGARPSICIGVRLKGDPALYRSDHRDPLRSVSRDGPFATTVELPPGVKRRDIRAIVALRRPSWLLDNHARVRVLGVNRAFFLGDDRLPRPSFLHSGRSLLLTSKRPTATIWRAGA